MGIFSRIGEIVNANVNAMLDRAEDPAKMMKLMVHEMEDTLMEIKSSAAEVIADEKRLARQIAQNDEKASTWSQRAELAVSKGRDDLAREALEQKFAYESRSEQAKLRLNDLETVVHQYRTDIQRLEEKLNSVRMRQASLEERRRQLIKSKKVSNHIYRLESDAALERFEHYESKIDRLEADAELQVPASNQLDRRFLELEHQAEVEQALDQLKSKRKSPKKD
ncbi:MAG: PspA/IM30 family protein [Acidobacteria bacterium]|nr:PspA/IM30 family protein [Acidobacteriota bacterium]